MEVKLKSKRQFQQYEQFQPLELIEKGEIELFHEACAGGKVSITSELSTEEPILFECSICGQTARLSPKNAIQAIRAVIPGKEKESIATGINYDIHFSMA